jgi:transposase InsO family protein
VRPTLVSRDVFSRYVVGWMIAPRESAGLAHPLIAATCDKEGIARGQLTLHADRGTSMRSKPVALLLAVSVPPGATAGHVSNGTIRTRKRGSRPQPCLSALRHRLHDVSGGAHRPGTRLSHLRAPLPERPPQRALGDRWWTLEYYSGCGAKEVAMRGG